MARARIQTEPDWLVRGARYRFGSSFAEEIIGSEDNSTRRSSMADLSFFESIGRDLSGRGLLGGKFQLRLILQPLAAILLGLRFGLRDAKRGRPPFFQALAEEKGDRAAMLKEAARDALIPLAIAFLLDSILQHIINGRIRPLAAVVVGGLLVFLPFLIVRGLSNRAWSHGHPGQPRPASKP